jgi:UDP-glucose 4-epimerase
MSSFSATKNGGEAISYPEELETSQLTPYPLAHDLPVGQPGCHLPILETASDQTGFDYFTDDEEEEIPHGDEEPSPEPYNPEQTGDDPERTSVIYARVNTGYEASKMARERYGEYFANHYDLSMAGMRFFSVYQGYGGAEGHKGEYANVIAQFADDIANGQRAKLYGDGTQTRDFTHVNDIVRGLVMAADQEISGIYNLGTGEAYSFNTVVEMLNDELGTDINPEYVENPIPDDVYVHDTCADPSKMTAATGWVPEIDFQEGIRRVCEQYK